MGGTEAIDREPVPYSTTAKGKVVEAPTSPLPYAAPQLTIRLTGIDDSSLNI